MGCGYSCKRRSQPTSLTPMYKVTNVDTDGKQKYRGTLEVTAENLALHVNGRKSPIVWPLRSIRQYGYEESMFCFEANQSAPYGPDGIFPFKSADAKIIFDDIKEKLKVMHDAQLAQDIASVQPTTSMQTIERPYENDVVFNGIKWSMDMESTYNMAVQPQQSVQIKPMHNGVVLHQKPLHIEHSNNGPILPKKQLQKSTRMENWNNGPVLPPKQMQKSIRMENWNDGSTSSQKQVQKEMKIQPMYNGPISPQKSMPIEPMSDEAISLQSPYTSVLYNHRKLDDLPNNAQEASEDTLIYSELEFPPSPESSRKPPSVPFERSTYSTIDFNWTAKLNRKMFICHDNTGTRKTRHDSSLSD